FEKQDQDKIQNMVTYINGKHTYINYALKTENTANIDISEEALEILLDSDPNDLTILDKVAMCLTCPFTQKVTDDFRLLPCGHKISYRALENFMKKNYNSPKCLHCRADVQMRATKALSSSPIYKALYDKFVKAGHIEP